jgi:putative SOS response-associated peptidase YedK
MNYLGVDRWDSNFIRKPSYNIAPTQETPVLTYNNKRIIQGMHWGLVPNWSKDYKIGTRMINARAETLTEKPAYASLLQSQRCIIIANGYYEWKRTKQGRRPYYIHDPENSILPFAGLWDKWKNDKKQHRITCTIITTEPSTEMKRIHSRMPVILRKDRMDEWIDCSYPQAEVLQLLKPYSEVVAYYPVSTFVNIPLNNSQKCIEPMIMEE